MKSNDSKEVVVMVTKDRLVDMIKYCSDRSKPKVTISLPTHHRSPENKQDPILYKNLILKLKKEFEENYSRRVWEELFNKLSDLGNDTLFWNHTSDGLVVIGCDDRIETFDLSYQPVESVSVGEAFHIHPLISFKNLYETYYLADLAKDRVTVYEAHREGIHEVKDELQIKTFSEIYSDFDSNSDVNAGSYGGLDASYHGHRARPEEVRKDRRKYFRYLDKTFQEMASANKREFILAGTTENLAEFKEISQGKYFFENDIDKPIKSYNERQIIEIIKELVRPHREKNINDIEIKISNAARNNKLIDKLEELPEALANGQIESIYIFASDSDYINLKLDSIINDAFLSGVDTLVLDKKMTKSEYNVAAILRY